MFLTNRILCALFMLALLVLPLAAQAQGQIQGTRVAVVDVEKILNDSKAGKSIQSQLTTSREAFQKEFGAREDGLMASQKSLIEKKGDLSSEEFAKKRQEFEKQISETRKLFQKRRSSLDKGLTNALSELRKNIVKVTAEVANEGKFQLVVTRDSVVIVEKDMDITDKVLARLDTQIQKINLDTSKE